MTQYLRALFFRFCPPQNPWFQHYRQLRHHVAHYRTRAITLAVMLSMVALVFLGAQSPAQATLNDDTYDGNIYALYGGNGSIVPPRMTITQSLAIGRPVMVVYYVDDSADCKRFSPILNYTQGLYSKAISLIPVAVDSIATNDADPAKPSPEVQLYRGTVPQTVLVNATGEVVFDQEGLMPFETVDAEIRKMLGLAPAPKGFKVRSTERAINEINP